MSAFSFSSLIKILTNGRNAQFLTIVARSTLVTLCITGGAKRRRCMLSLGIAFVSTYANYRVHVYHGRRGRRIVRRLRYLHTSEVLTNKPL